MRAVGWRPNSCAFSAVHTIMAAAPSEMGQALAGVTVPPFLNTVGYSPAFCTVRLGLIVSSWMIFSRATSRPATRLTISTGTISSSNFPMRWAMNAFLWDWMAYLSCSSREMSYFSARFSAVRPMICSQMGSVRPSHRPSVSSAWRSLYPHRACLSR